MVSQETTVPRFVAERPTVVYLDEKGFSESMRNFLAEFTDTLLIISKTEDQRTASKLIDLVNHLSFSSFKKTYFQNFHQTSGTL